MLSLTMVEIVSILKSNIYSILCIFTRLLNKSTPLKKKYLLSTCVVLLCFWNGLSQDIDYYKSIADTAQNSLTRLVALDSVISKVRLIDEDEFISYSKEYIELAEKVDSVDWAAKKIINISYTLVSIKNDPETALALIDELLSLKKKVKDSFLLGSIYSKRGSANFRLNIKEATKDYATAISTFTEKDSIHIADAYLFSGQAYSNLGEFAPAGENYRKAYQYFEALKDYEYMNYAQQGITTMFSMNGFYDKAREEREKNIEKMKELGLDTQLATIYYNQALDYKKMKDRKKQIEFLLKALEVVNLDYKQEVFATDRIFIFAKLIDYYIEEDDQENVDKYFAMVQENHDPKAKDLIYLSQYYEVTSKYLLIHKKYPEALEFAKKKMVGAQQLQYIEDIIASHELYSMIYAAMGDYKNAFSSKEIYTRLEDSVYNATTANSLAYYQTLYETEKKEKEIMAKNSSIQMLEKDNESTQKRMILIVLALLLTFGIIILFRNRAQITQKKRLQEQFSQKLLVSQEEERKRISTDLHDGLGQQLLIIKNKLTQKNDSETKNLVEGVIEDVRSISRNLHPFQLQELGITRAIQMTLNQIDENTTLFISSEIDNIDHVFDKTQEMNLYRIIQETLTNIIKHAKAEASKVTLKKELKGIRLEIKDNGVGFDFTSQYKNIQSLGLKTLLERAKFLNGHMKVQSIAGQGTTFEFYFPTS